MITAAKKLLIITQNNYIRIANVISCGNGIKLFYSTVTLKYAMCLLNTFEKFKNYLNWAQQKLTICQQTEEQ